MRVLRRLLDIKAGRPVLINFESCHRTFFFSNLVEDGEENIRVEDSKTGDVLVSDEWSEVADFIRKKGEIKAFVCNDECLYTLILTLVCVAYLNSKSGSNSSDKEMAELLVRLSKEEPALKQVLRHVW